VNNNCGKRRRGGRATQSIICGSVAALAILAALAVSGIASLKKEVKTKRGMTSPTTPAAITPPAGSAAFLWARSGYARLCLSTHKHRRFVDCQCCSPRSHPFYEYLRRGRPDHHSLLSPNTNPNEFAPNPLPFGNPTWQSSLVAARCGAKRHMRSLPAPIRVARMLAMPASCAGRWVRAGASRR